MGLEQLRDHLDLHLVAPSQPCRIEGSDGRYVVGELVHGHVFRDLARHGVSRLPAESLDEEAPDEDDETADDPEDPALEHEHETEEAAPAATTAPAAAAPEPSDDDEPDEMTADPHPKPLWSRHPSILAFPLQISATILLAAGAAVVWRFDWSGGATAALASMTVFSVSLLLWRKTANHLQIFPDFVVIRSGVPWRRMRTLRREEITGLQACRHGFGRWIGLGCVEIRTVKERIFRLRGYRRTRKAETIWQQGPGA